MSRQITLQKELLVANKSSFKFYLSTYSAKFTSIDDKLIKKFVSENRSKMVFSYSNKLKKEIADNPKEIEKVDRVLLQYFSFCRTFLETPNLKINKIINIDLKSAYINVLKNEGYISEGLFLGINKLKKKDRLVTLGMLAHEPDLFTFENGVYIHYEKIKNEYSDYFFFAVKRVHEIICNCRFLLGHNFIFSWVDGFYFIENNNAEKKVMNYLNKIGYNYTREILTDFESNFINGNAEIKFNKGKSKKAFSIPTDCNSKKIMDTLIIKNKILKTNDYSRNTKISYESSGQ